MKSDHGTYWIAAILAAALAIKLGYLFFAYPGVSSVANLSVDEMYHYRWASSIAGGNILINAPYFRAPLYPFFLAVLLAVSGKSLIFVRIVQMLLGCLTVFITYRFTERVAGRAAAVLASIFMILYPITTYFDGELLLDPLFAVLALLLLYYILVPEDRPARPIICGVLFALAALTRPTILIFAPFIIAYYFHRGIPRERCRESLKTVLRFIMAAALVIAPVTIINAAFSGQFILISYQGGVNFYIGNNPHADGFTSELPPYGPDWDLVDASYLAQQATGRKEQYAAQSFFWYRQGMQFILDHPADFVKLFARKMYFLFSGNEISNNRPLDEVVFGNSLLSILPIRFSLLIACALLPLFLVRRERRSAILLYGVILLYGAILSMFFVSSRFRLPLVPLVAILAGWGVVSLWETIRRRHFGYRLFLGMAAAVAAFAAASSTPAGISFENPSQALFLRGNQALRLGDYHLAMDRFDSLTNRQPDYPNGFLNLGIAHLKMGQVEQAAQAFREEIRYHPRSAEAYNNLGVIFLLDNQIDSARFYCRRALEMKPYYTDAAVNYLRAAQKVTAPAVIDSIDQFRRTIRQNHNDNPAYLFEEGLYFVKLGRLNEAIANDLKVVDLLTTRPAEVTFEPEYSSENSGEILSLACYQLGYLYGLTGRYEQSLRYSRQAVAHNPNLRQAYINLISAYRSAGKQREADSVASEYRSRWPNAPLP
jgi:tetratricopeptide (TPR) repeat protein/4-amino-4-deoxy-L-arabinose transferase-like glycosyltransferase